jgi:NADP-dependent aldehyde dehydrogenase
VIVKAHPAHAETSQLVADAIHRAAEKCGLPKGIFAHLHGRSNEVGKALVQHPLTAAVGFTGSYGGGKQLFDWANQRPAPIPVFAEMGSVNPIFLLPERLAADCSTLVSQCAASITLGVGQFCTNPGLIIGMDSPLLSQFIHDLGKAMQATMPARMLHPGIAAAYREKRANALLQEDMKLVAEAAEGATDDMGAASLATTTGTAFIGNPVLHHEVFGPYSLVVRCKDEQEMQRVAESLEGQLTTTLMAGPGEVETHPELVEILKDKCGRFILNGVPTGVEVCLSMQHGGPFPSTTDSRYTSVGADGIRRFARPQAYQNWDDKLLPEALQNKNPLGIWRMVNNQWSKDSL